MIFFPVSAAILISYLWGSLSWSIMAGKLIRGIDIREEGSGNAGATNALRVLGKGIGLTVLLMDFLKGMIPLLFVPFFASSVKMADQGETYLSLVLLLSIMTGHMFPLWFGFRGGKGVACGAGGITVLFPVGALFCLGVFLLVTLVTKFVSLASLSAAWALPFFYSVLGALDVITVNPVYLSFYIVVAIIITLLHYKNIKRLLQGSENRISLKRRER